MKGLGTFGHLLQPIPPTIKIRYQSIFYLESLIYISDLGNYYSKSGANYTKS